MKYTKYISGAAVAVSLAALALAVPLSGSFADAATVGVTGSVGFGMGGQGGGQGGPQGNWGGHGNINPGGPMMRPAVFGKVSAINGDSLTVTQGAHPGFGSSTAATATTTYTVDASNATVIKNNATSTVSSIAVGDMVAVQGTVSGTNVTATVIRDGFGGMMMGGRRMGGMGSTTRPGGPNGGQYASSSPITGNGQPVIAGTISAINGSSLTITNKSNVSYTVDASNANVVEGNSKISVSNLAVGDNVIVQGAVNGTSVTASSIIDQKAPSAGTSSSAGSHGGGIFAAIGGFFSRIFGF